jgi:hypothetical protein
MPCYGCRRVVVVKRDEVHILGEEVDHREHHRFVVDAWKRLDEVKCDVSPNRRWHLEGLEDGGVQVLRLVPLTCCVGAHKFSDDGAAAGYVEVGVQSMQHLGGAFMARVVCSSEHLVETGRGDRQVNAAFDEDQAILYVPYFSLGVRGRFLPATPMRILAPSVEHQKAGMRGMTVPWSSSPLYHSAIRRQPPRLPCPA